MAGRQVIHGKNQIIGGEHQPKPPAAPAVKNERNDEAGEKEAKNHRDNPGKIKIKKHPGPTSDSRQPLAACVGQSSFFFH